MFRGYCLLWQKRAKKRIVQMLLLTLLLSAILLVSGSLLARDMASEASRQKLKIAVTGDISGDYLGFGIHMLQQLDISRLTVTLITMGEAEARHGLMTGEIAAWIRMPEGFMDSVISGENRKLEYITAGGTQNIGDLLLRDMAETASLLITESQSRIYSMQRYLYENGMEDRWHEETVELSMQYLSLILGRSGLFDLQLMGVSGGLAGNGWLFCSVLILFLLFSGIGGCSLFIRQETELMRILSAKELEAGKQVMAEFLTCFFTLAVSFGAFAVLLIGVMGALSKYGGLGQESFGPEKPFLFFVALVPVILLFAAFQLFLYELVSDFINGVMIQFMGAVCMGYLSGCFYPASFFPDAVRKIGSVLPVGCALHYAQTAYREGTAWKELVWISLYAALFLIGTVLVRRARITTEWR